MPYFVERSKNRLNTCHKDLQTLFNKVVATYNCTIIEGHRCEADQNACFNDGKSTLEWPKSKHNCMPSKAIDVAPWPLDFDDKARFYHFAGYVMGIASVLGIRVRWGGDWDQDKDFNDQRLNDLVHWELVD